jgi:serine/threonine-protein kinase
MAPVNHPAILRVRDYGEEKDLVYVVTDFVPGSSLRQVIDRKGPFSWSDGRTLMLDLISAARTLHAHGLLAFGLTPSIIRLTEAERQRLVISSAGVTEIHEVLTRAGADPVSDRDSIDCDAFYLAPELLIGEKPDGRTDIFMIGAIGYELFTGKPPYAATTMPELITAALSADIDDPRQHAPSLPVEAALCVLRCLAPRPDKRFFDAIELEHAWQTIPV